MTEHTNKNQSLNEFKEKIFEQIHSNNENKFYRYQFPMVPENDHSPNDSSFQRYHSKPSSNEALQTEDTVPKLFNESTNRQRNIFRAKIREQFFRK